MGALQIITVGTVILTALLASGCKRTIVFLIVPGRGQFLELVKNRLWLVFLMAALAIPFDYIWSLMMRDAFRSEPFTFEQFGVNSPLVLQGRESLFKLLVATWWLTEAAVYGVLLVCWGFKALTAVYGGCYFASGLNLVVMRLLGKLCFKLRLCEFEFPDGPTCLFLSPLLMFLACMVCLLWL